MKLVSMLPDDKVRKVTYDIPMDEIPPVEVEYMVTVCKGRVPGTVYQVCSVRRINSKSPALLKHNLVRYAIELIRRPQMLARASIKGFRLETQLSIVYPNINNE